MIDRSDHSYLVTWCKLHISQDGAPTQRETCAVGPLGHARLVQLVVGLLVEIRRELRCV